jgi:hypothetical protein
MIMLSVGKKLAGISVEVVPSPPEEQFDINRNIAMKMERGIWV